ncbi:MAG: TIGR02281 family clan AA aspartic protease [Proteobacteria bacterium]|nr:TIGR02281 family clan AA aspartic protease [Pseudomonadota bacterium]
MSERWEQTAPGRPAFVVSVLGWAVRQVVIWSIVAGLGFAAYTYRDVLFGPQAPEGSQEQRTAKQTAKGSRKASRPASRALTIRASAGGHFVVEADVDGADIRFMVDTGATEVVLTPEDAARIGFDLRARNFTRQFNTAGGIIRAAPVTLRRLRIGQLVMRDVEAWVNEAPLFVSLLGMSFLKRLDGYEVKDGKLILYW